MHQLERFDQCVVTPKERIKAIDAWKQPSSTSFKVVNSLKHNRKHIQLRNPMLLLVLHWILPEGIMTLTTTNKVSFLS